MHKRQPGCQCQILEGNLLISSIKSERIYYLPEFCQACRKYILHAGKDLSNEYWNKFIYPWKFWHISSSSRPLMTYEFHCLQIFLHTGFRLVNFWHKGLPCLEEFPHKVFFVLKKLCIKYCLSTFFGVLLVSLLRRHLAYDMQFNYCSVLVSSRIIWFQK